MDWRNSRRRMLRRLMRVSALWGAASVLARAGFLPPGVWKRLPVEGLFPVVLPDRRSFLYSATANDGIARALYWRGLDYWERETLPVFYRLAQSASLVLDVGANTGFYTLLACVANERCRVCSFEPVPHVYKRLCEHIGLNGFDGRCETYEMAVSNFVGKDSFHIPPGEVPTSASLHPSGFRGFSGVLVEVPVTTIDIVIGDEPVDLAKIDVEGFEDRVLDGMQRTLANSRPTLIVECPPDGPYQRVEAILKDFGYNIYALRRQGPVRVERVVPERMYYENFLFVHPERGDVL